MPPPPTSYNAALGDSLMSSYFLSTPKPPPSAVSSNLEGYLSLPPTPTRSTMSIAELSDGGLSRIMERVEREEFIAPPTRHMAFARGTKISSSAQIKSLQFQNSELSLSNLRLKSRLTSLLNACKLMGKAGKRKNLRCVKEDCVAFSVLLDKKVMTLAGPSPADNSSSTQDPTEIDLLVLGLFKSLEHCFDIEHRKEFDSLTRERDVYKEMHEAGVKERQDLERRILTAENQLVTEKNKSKEQLSLYDGSLGIGNPERIVVEDDRALIELGIQPANIGAIEGGAIVTSKHKRELDIVRGQRDFLQREVEDLMRRTKGAVERESARVCDMSRMADEVETLRGKIEMSEDGRTKLWDELEKGRRKVSKLKERERSFTKSGREAKELGEMAVREAERTMEKARRAVVRNRRPLVNAKRVAYSMRSDWVGVKEGVRRDIESCFLDLSEIVSSSFFTLTSHVTGISEARSTIHQESLQRRKEIQELMDRRGRVRVVLRIRPGEGNCVGVERRGSGYSVTLKKGDTYNDGGSGRFLFDAVMGSSLPSALPDSVITLGREVIPFALGALAGLKVCIVAYGQTGSGKTKTIGEITDLLVRRMFAESGRGGKVEVTVGYVEVYNSEVRDLLRKPEGKEEGLAIRMGEDGGGDVDNINVVIRGAEELGDIIRRGNDIRSTFATSLNDRSSRSHSILRLLTTVTDSWTGEGITGRVDLVDLAGSERMRHLRTDTVAGVKDKDAEARNAETRFINSSLHSLHNVLNSLVTPNQFVPFRSSPLTRLLQGSLREGKVCVVTCVRREGKWRGESKGSLEFGGRARRVKIREGKKGRVRVEEIEGIEEDSMDEGGGGGSGEVRY